MVESRTITKIQLEIRQEWESREKSVLELSIRYRNMKFGPDKYGRTRHAYALLKR